MIASQAGNGKEQEQVIGSRVLSDGKLESVLVVLGSTRTKCGKGQTQS